MRIHLVLLWLLALLAQPAFAANSQRLQPLEQELAWLISGKSANLGVAALDLSTGEVVSVNGHDAFPMASTVKVAVAANYLAQVEFGRRSLDDRIGGRSAASLLDAMITRSDNHATDLLIRNLGGPSMIQSWLMQHKVEGIRFDRTIARLLADRRDLWDVRDSSTPIAMVQLLQKLDSGKLLKPTSRSYLLDLMGRCATGKNRMRALLPYGTRVEHKTGTLNNYTSDVGFITLPDGRRLAVAFFARGSGDRPRAIAEAARKIYDGFMAVPRSIYSTIAAPAATAFQP
ncbi:MAG TPA: serine hydrolase [Sphingomicrobium sp.]|nr:serine hydrolase [Sphingomicrobium sp.]